MFRALLLPPLAWTCACGSITSGQRAETLGKGEVEVSVETSYQAALERDTVLAFPLMSAVGRVGVTDRVDIGGRLSSAGLGVESKIGLLERDRLQLALAPSMDWVHARDQGIGFDTLETATALIGSFRLRPGLELLASPRIHSSLLQVTWNESSLVHTLGVGSGVGVAIQSRRFWIIPEVGVLYPFLITGEPADEMGGTTMRLGRVIAQISVSVAFGSPR